MLPTPPTLSRDQTQRWREILRRHDYTAAGIAQSVVSGPLQTLIDLFIAGKPVASGRFKKAIEPMRRRDFERASIVRTEADRVHPLISLVPHGEMLFASDRGAAGPAGTSEFVMGLGAGTITLSQAMVAAPGGRVLDLGTGCGMLAVCAAVEAAEVVATDLNPRALKYVELNAAINGLDNVTASLGDMFAADTAELGTFDLVVCHPPHVISPRNGQMYSDAPEGDDAFIAKLISVTASLLRPGGVAQILGNWLDLEKASWRDRLAAWLNGSGCDAWVLANPLETPSDYAHRWLADRDDAEGDEHGKWIEHYRARGVAGICSGLINLRRPAEERAPWVAIDRAPPSISAGAGEHIRRGFAARDLLRGNVAIGALKPSVPPELRQRPVLEPVNGGWQETSCSTGLSRGLQYALDHNRLVGAMIRGCDGETTVDDIVADVAKEAGKDVGTLQRQAHGVIGQLLQFGLLVIHSDDSSA